MSDHEDEDSVGPKSHIAALRERAVQARRLANEIQDKLAREGLIQRAEEFERGAQEIEAQLATRQTESRLFNDIAAFKSPGRKPEGER